MIFNRTYGSPKVIIFLSSEILEIYVDKKVIARIKKIYQTNLIIYLFILLIHSHTSINHNVVSF